MSDDQMLIDAAAELLALYRDDGVTTVARVACALVTADGEVFRGVSLATRANLGHCAEHGAVSALATSGRTAFEAIVAVRLAADASVEVVPPCGRCREFLRGVDGANESATVLLPGGRSATLAELLPEPWHSSTPRHDLRTSPLPGHPGWPR